MQYINAFIQVCGGNTESDISIHKGPYATGNSVIIRKVLVGDTSFWDGHNIILGGVYRRQI